MKVALATLTVLILASPARAHRLDEYLQATRIDLSLDRIVLEMALSPGVAVAPRVVPLIDADGDGLVSDDEERAYVRRVIGDLWLELGGKRLTLRARRAEVPPVSDLMAGTGTVHLELEAVDAQASSGRTSLVFRNDHQRDVSTYLVNPLVPDEPRIAVAGQRRDVLQRGIEVTYDVAVGWRWRWVSQLSWLMIGLVGVVLLGAMKNWRIA
jgi:hypothetical protein